jgi:2-hydroxy-6-oxonona-2,4-dienedioate hydrolase
MKKVWRTLFIIIIVLMMIPYFITRDFDQDIPQQPFANSKFYYSEQDVMIHTRVWEPTGEIKGQLLLIHGLGASTFSFRHQSEALAQAGYFVVAVDLPAFGYSDRQKGIDHSQKSRANMLWQVMDQIKADYALENTWSLIGHSMGASTTLALSSQRPQDVSKLVLIAPAITQDNNSIGWVLTSPLGEWLKVYLRYIAINETSFARLLETASNQPVSDEMVLGYLEPLKTKGTNQALLDFVASASNVLIQDWSATQIPVLIIWGEQDTWVPYDQINEIEPYIPDLTLLVLEEQGHLPHEMAYEVVNDKIIVFLNP